MQVSVPSPTDNVPALIGTQHGKGTVPRASSSYGTALVVL